MDESRIARADVVFVGTSMAKDMGKKEDTASSSSTPPPKRFRSSSSPQALNRLVSCVPDKPTQDFITLERLQLQRDQTSLATSRHVQGAAEVYSSKSSQRSLVLTSISGHRGKRPVQELHAGKEATNVVDSGESCSLPKCPSASVNRNHGRVNGGSSLDFCSKSLSIRNDVDGAGSNEAGKLMLQRPSEIPATSGAHEISGEVLSRKSSRPQDEPNATRPPPNEVCRDTRNSVPSLDDHFSDPNIHPINHFQTRETIRTIADGFVPRDGAENVLLDRSVPQSPIIIVSSANLNPAGGGSESAASRLGVGDVTDTQGFVHERNSSGIIYTRIIPNEPPSSEIEGQPVSHHLQSVSEEQRSLNPESAGNARIGRSARFSDGMSEFPMDDPGSSSRDVEAHPRVPFLGLRTSQLHNSQGHADLDGAAESRLQERDTVENSIVQPMPPVNAAGEPALPVEIITTAQDLSVDTKALDDQDSSEGETLTCPICMEPWTNSGDHQICSLACGHLFGKSCIRRWLQQSAKKRGKCPHCNKRAKLEDLRPLYVPHIAVADAEGQQLAKEVHALRAENLELKANNAKLLKELSLTKEKQGPDHDLQRVGRINGQVSLRSSSSLATIGSHGDNFVLQNEVHIHGGKVFDMDADSQMVIISNKPQGCVSSFGLIKMSLLACTEVENISFPSGFGAIRDIKLTSSVGGPGKLALVASIGKKLSIVSMESNNIVLTYSLQSPPWSCTWDPCFPNLLYSGLQDGSLAVFDLRQTSSPITLLKGSSTRPIHTLQPVPDQVSSQEGAGNHQPSSRGVLSASSSGIFLWKVGSSSAPSETVRPQCIFARKDRVCVSLAYERSINAAVASLRQSPLAQSEASLFCTPESYAAENTSQSFMGLSQSGPPVTTTAEDHHWIFARNPKSPWPRPSNGETTTAGENMSSHGRPHWHWVGEMVGHKSSSVMSRTAIVSEWKSTSASKSLFACGDEASNAVMLWDMQSCRIKQTLGPHPSRVLDIKNVQIAGKDLMGCVSGSTFQLYQRKAMTH